MDKSKVARFMAHGVVVISRSSLCYLLQLMNVLEEDEFARNYQLANKLQKVHLLMRVRV